MTPYILRGLIFLQKFSFFVDITTHASYNDIRNKETHPKGRYKMKVKEVRTMTVSMTFGSIVTLSVKIYEGKTLNECLKMRSEEIDGVIIDGLYVRI